MLKTRDGVHRDSKAGDDGVGEDQVHQEVVKRCPDLRSWANVIRLFDLRLKSYRDTKILIWRYRDIEAVSNECSE